MDYGWRLAERDLFVYAEFILYEFEKTENIAYEIWKNVQIERFSDSAPKVLCMNWIILDAIRFDDGFFDEPPSYSLE